MLSKTTGSDISRSGLVSSMHLSVSAVHGMSPILDPLSSILKFSPRPYHYRHSVLRPERDRRQQLERPIIEQLDAPALHNGCEHQHRFHPGERFADALA